jgi:hypothetical protein
MFCDLNKYLLWKNAASVKLLLILVIVFDYALLYLLNY